MHIQLEVTSNQISPAAQRIIWENILGRVTGKDERGGLWSDDLLDALSDVKMNGREIKNILGPAKCHASGENLLLILGLWST